MDTNRRNKLRCEVEADRPLHVYGPNSSELYSEIVKETNVVLRVKTIPYPQSFWEISMHTLGKTWCSEGCDRPPRCCWPICRAGLSKCEARLEALLRGPTQRCLQKFLIGHQVILFEIVDVKERGLRHAPQFSPSSWDFNGQRRNQFTSY